MKRGVVLAAGAALVVVGPALVAGPSSASPLGPGLSLLGTQGGVMTVPVDSSQPYYIDGVVTDPSGSGIGGITVNDGTQQTTTAPSGAWSLPEPATGQYLVTISSDRTDEARGYIQAPGVPDAFGATISVPYTIGVASWTSTGPTSSLEIFSNAPAPGTLGQSAHSCVTVTDFFSGTRTSASYTGTTDAGGAFLWSASLPSSISRVQVEATDCASGTPLTDVAGQSYPIAGPNPGVGGPIEWADTANPVIAFAASDAGGVNPNSAKVIVDGTSLAVGFDPGLGAFEAQARGLAPGGHSLEISVSDNAGNTAQQYSTLAVDLTAPSLGGPQPEVSSPTASPNLAVPASDVVSGVDAAASEFILTNGVTATTLRPTYQDRTLSYQVPSALQGINLGQGPLPPGTYSVSAIVADFAGNEIATNWTFTVNATAPT